MANKIIMKKSSVAAKIPLATDLEVGEIAGNLEDQKLYSKKPDGTVVLMGSGLGGSGDVEGPSSATDGAVALFDGTTGKIIKNGQVPGTIYTQNANNVSITGGSIDATVAYDNATSGLAATDVQAAIDETAIGSAQKPILISNLNTITVNGWYTNGDNDTANGLPGTFVNGLILHSEAPEGAGAVQFFFRAGSQSVGDRLFRRGRDVTTGIWEAWSSFYHSENIVGNVSQSGGVPTGAIIERDGNANGIYTKWADGTMICSFVQSGGGDTRWDFPATFTFTPEISATILFDSTNQGRAAFILSRGTGSCRHVGWSIGSGGTLNMSATANRLLIAYGRWF